MRIGSIIKIMMFVLLFVSAKQVDAQGIIVYKNNGTEIYKIPYSEVDSITTYDVYENEEFNVVADAVDLGLPSGLKWASWNLGASSPEGFGNYYSWGEILCKTDYALESYIYYDSDSNSYKYIGDNISGTEYDVAHIEWGDEWRMPTIAECEELKNECSWEKTMVHGISGYKVTGVNGNSIFMPACGLYKEKSVINVNVTGTWWCGDLNDYTYARIFSASLENGPKTTSFSFRYYGRCVRPVHN